MRKMVESEIIVKNSGEKEEIRKESGDNWEGIAHRLLG